MNWIYRMIKTALGLLLLLTVACASKISKSVVVLDYADFGPQAMAYELLGRKRLAWDPTAPVIIGQSRISVVVYRGVTLPTVREAYPVERGSNTDYRYLQYGEALNYLDARIEQNLLQRITPRLKRARRKIQAQLN